MKLCKDCKHHTDRNKKYNFMSDSYSRRDTCLLKVVSVDHLHGDNEYENCITMRGSVGCGTEALLFEPKLSLWANLNNIFRKPL